MKKIVSTLVLCAVAATFAGTKRTHDHSTQKPIRHATEVDVKVLGHVLVSIPTVQCTMDKKIINKAVYNLKGVGLIRVNLDEKTAYVAYEPTKVRIEEIENTIAASGYDANGVKRDKKASERLPSCSESKS